MVLKFACLVNKSSEFEGHNGPAYESSDELFMDDTFDGLMEQLSEDRYYGVTRNMQHGYTLDEINRAYGPVLVIMGENPMDLNDLKGTKFHKDYMAALSMAYNDGNLSKVKYDAMKDA